MKKFLSLILALTFIFSLSGCKKSDSKSEGNIPVENVLENLEDSSNIESKVEESDVGEESSNNVEVESSVEVNEVEVEDIEVADDTEDLGIESDVDSDDSDVDSVSDESSTPIIDPSITAKIDAYISEHQSEIAKILSRPEDEPNEKPALVYENQEGQLCVYEPEEDIEEDEHHGMTDEEYIAYIDAMLEEEAQKLKDEIAAEQGKVYQDSDTSSNENNTSIYVEPNPSGGKSYYGGFNTYEEYINDLHRQFPEYTIEQIKELMPDQEKIYTDQQVLKGDINDNRLTGNSGASNNNGGEVGGKEFIESLGMGGSGLVTGTFSDGEGGGRHNPDA